MRRSAYRLAIPIAAYLFIAVFLPLLNGAAARPEFRAHCLAIAEIGGTLAMMFLALHLTAARIRERKQK